MEKIKTFFQDDERKIFLRRMRTLLKCYLIGLFAFAVVYGALVILFGDPFQNHMLVRVASVFGWFCCINLWYVEARKMGRNDRVRFGLEGKRFSVKSLQLAGGAVISVLLFAAFLVLLFWVGSEALAFLFGSRTMEAMGTPEERAWELQFLEWFVKFCFSGCYWIAKPLGNTLFGYGVGFLTFPLVLVIGHVVGMRVSLRDKLKQEIAAQKGK